MLQHLDRRTFSAFVPDPFVSREDLLKMLLVDFGVVSIADLKRGSLNGASRPDLSYPLYEFLDSLVPLQAFAVLIIDEAQNLPLPLLEEVRILSDLEGREKLLQVVLVGQPELREHLKLPEMRQVNQRVSVRCELSPLTRDGVRGYVEHRLRVAGEGSAQVEFAGEALDAVYEASGGTPRLINLICDRALHYGYSARVERIEPHFVWDAISDLRLDVARPKPAAAEPPAPVLPKLSTIATPTTAPAPSRIADPVKPAAEPVRTRSASPIPTPHRELLSDFAPESDLDGFSREKTGIARGWKLVAASTLVAVIAIGGMLAYTRVKAASEVPNLRFPPPPQKVVATLPAIVPQFVIQVASFQTLSRAERLVAQLTTNGYRARAIEVDLGQDGHIVEVLVGNYATELDANPDLDALRSQYGFLDARVEPFVGARSR